MSAPYDETCVKAALKNFKVLRALDSKDTTPETKKTALACLLDTSMHCLERRPIERMIDGAMDVSLESATEAVAKHLPWNVRALARFQTLKIDWETHDPI